MEFDTILLFASARKTPWINTEIIKGPGHWFDLQAGEQGLCVALCFYHTAGTERYQMCKEDSTGFNKSVERLVGFFFMYLKDEI